MRLTMNKKALHLTAVFSLALTGALPSRAPAQSTAAAEGEISAAQVIAAADRIRNPGVPFRLTNTIVEYVNGTPRSSVRLAVYAKENGATHQYRNLVQYIAPQRDHGKTVLLDGSQMWYYDPYSKASVRISQQQRLLGQASNGDAVTVNLARDYRPTVVGVETVNDADGKSRACWHLNLQAATADAVYNRMDYWIEQKTAYSVKAKYYSDSGRLLKTVYFRNYQNRLDGQRPTEIVILDGVDKSLVTTMNYSDYRAAEIPDAWFQRDFLSKFRAE
jgi:hypothetical protein